MLGNRMRFVSLAAMGLCLATPVYAEPPEKKLDAREVAAKMDELIALRLKKASLKPAPLADDATFFRRAHLDVVGRTPCVSDVRRFLRDRSSLKREQSIDRLLDTPGYAGHFSSIWAKLLMPEGNSNIQKRYMVPQVENWLRNHFHANSGFDKVVRELLTVPLSREQTRNFSFSYSVTSPLAFYRAKEGKPADLAAGTARLFLGVRLECARCHDHPFGKWTREQFWGFAAFFGGIRARSGFYGPLSELSDRRELNIPNTERVAQARFLDGTRPRWQYKVGARTTLADWLTARDNPFFARAMVNRMWEHFFGLGLVDPVDDFRDDNPPSHPKVLDLLAREFAAHDFDLKFLIRVITYSKTYQRSSSTRGASPNEQRMFARMAVRGLTPEQLYNSLVEATGARPLNRRNLAFAFNSSERQFLDKFDVQQEKTAYQTSIPQALAMMNNRLITTATNPESGRTLSAVANAPFLDTRGRVEALFLAALGRKPRAEEAKKYIRYVAKGGATGDKKKALGDVFWALLNSPEFFFNH